MNRLAKSIGYLALIVVLGAASLIGFSAGMPPSLQAIPLSFQAMTHIEGLADADRIGDALERTRGFQYVLQKHTRVMKRYGHGYESERVATVPLSAFGFPYYQDRWAIKFRTTCWRRDGKWAVYTQYHADLHFHINDLTVEYFGRQCETPGCERMNTLLRGVRDLQQAGLFHSYWMEISDTYLHGTLSERTKERMCEGTPERFTGPPRSVDLSQTP
jgi:hypothetical protein